MPTVKQLAERLAKAERTVADLKEQIAARAGEVDDDATTEAEPETATAKPAKATATKKAAG